MTQKPKLTSADNLACYMCDEKYRAHPDDPCIHCLGSGFIWHYVGDVSIEHGGTWFNLSTWDHGYIPFLRVEDINDYAEGAVALTQGTIYGTDDREVMADALTMAYAPREVQVRLRLLDYYQAPALRAGAAAAWDMLVVAEALSAVESVDDRTEIFYQLWEDGPTEVFNQQATRVQGPEGLLAAISDLLLD